MFVRHKLDVLTMSETKTRQGIEREFGPVLRGVSDVVGGRGREGRHRGKPRLGFRGEGYFKNTKNLFIHIALIPEGDNPRVNPNILKCLLHSPVAKGYRLVVIASRAIVCKTPTHYLILNSLAFARGCVILRSHILFPLLLILLISHHI